MRKRPVHPPRRQWDPVFDKLQSPPAEGEARVYILHLVHMWKSDKFTA
ncbi:MAG TPA: hypothetical protein VF493_10695 [Terriglobales bacterium]